MKRRVGVVKSFILHVPTLLIYLFFQNLVSLCYRFVIHSQRLQSNIFLIRDFMQTNRVLGN